MHRASRARIRCITAVRFAEVGDAPCITGPHRGGNGARPPCRSVMHRASPTDNDFPTIRHHTRGGLSRVGGEFGEVASPPFGSRQHGVDSVGASAVERQDPWRWSRFRGRQAQDNHRRGRELAGAGVDGRLVDPLPVLVGALYAGPMGQSSDDRRARLAARLERMDAGLGPVKRTKAMAPSAWLCLVGLLLFCALFMHGAQRVGWLVFIAVGVLVELAIRRWQKRKR